MSDQQTINISIFDKEYQVSCKHDEIQALRDSAYYLDGKMREIKASGSVLGLDRLAVMAALNLTNELLAQSEKATQLDSKQAETSSRLADQQIEIQDLHYKVDSALNRLKAKT